jgi:arylsulfatase A-like enzyme
MLGSRARGRRVLWSDRYQDAVYEDGYPREMLIDLNNDPGEMWNLAVLPEDRAVVRRHREYLRQWYADDGQLLEEKYLLPSTSRSSTGWAWGPRRMSRKSRWAAEKGLSRYERCARTVCVPLAND